MVSERDIPEFNRGLVAIGTVPQGTHTITSKQASPLTKAMKMMAKARTKSTSRKSSTKSRGKTRSIEADQKVHFGKQSFGHSQFY